MCAAIEAVLKDDAKLTRDLGGTAGTGERSPARGTAPAWAKLALDMALATRLPRATAHLVSVDAELPVDAVYTKPLPD